MNSATIVYLFGVLCVLASPSFAAPPEVNRNAADDAKNELTSDLSNDAETFQPVNNQGGAPSVGPPVPANAPVAPNAPDAPKTPEFIGGGTGIITKIGFEGECMYIWDKENRFQLRSKKLVEILRPKSSVCVCVHLKKTI